MKFLRFVMIFILFFACSAPVPEFPETAFDSITADELFEHLKYLSSDEMRGRDTPSPELKKAAEYIANEFKSYGLKAPDKEGDFFQMFNCVRNSLDLTKSADGIPNKFSILKNGKKTEYEIKSDFAPLFNIPDKEVSAPVVFAGYGITAPEYNYDDYEGIDVKGKIVLVISREPQESDENSVFNGRKRTEYSFQNNKLQNAIDHGAVGFIISRSPSELGSRPYIRWSSLLNRNINIAPLSLDLGHDDSVPAVFIHRDIAEEMVKNAGKTLKDIKEEIDKDLKPRSFEIPGLKANISTRLIRKKEPTQNVVGLLEGSDSKLKKEVVVIGAHYDHVGVNRDSIYNGADDNASGTCAVMEIAEAFAKAKNRPKRSVLFVAFSGEEKGLYGSRYYVENPLFPIEKTHAMLNIDMCSRNDPNQIYIVGSTYNPDLNEIAIRANEKTGLELSYEMDRFIRQSDHYPYLQRGIPSIFFFSGPHEDLHRPTDDYWKAQPDKMEKVSKLVFTAAWYAANNDKKLEVLPLSN